MSSFGFAAPALELRAAVELPPGATLKIAIGKDAAKSVDLTTVRVFRFVTSFSGANDRATAKKPLKAHLKNSSSPASNVEPSIMGVQSVTLWRG